MHSPAVTAIYARKSRPNESTLGSCEVQEAICRDTAEGFSWEIKEVFADDVDSASVSLQIAKRFTELNSHERGHLEWLSRQPVAEHVAPAATDMLVR